MIYLIGSLRNPQIPIIRQTIEDIKGEEVFASWYAAGPRADDEWMAYEKGRGLTYCDALQDFAAQNVLAFDRHHLDRCRAAILLYPAGRSGHTELGYVLGQQKAGYVLLDKEPGPDDRWDVMLGLATGVFTDLDTLLEVI